METRTGILSDKDIENVKGSIESIIFQYVGLLPNSVIIQNIDESLIGYSAENKEKILKDVLFYQNKINEKTILDNLSDEGYIKHVDDIKYRIENFDYNNFDLYYDATSNGNRPLHWLIEQQQLHLELNENFRAEQEKYKQCSQDIVKEYIATKDDIANQRGRHLVYAMSLLEEDIASIYKKGGELIYNKYENDVKIIYDKYDDEMILIYHSYEKISSLSSEQRDEALNVLNEQMEKKYISVLIRRCEELETIFKQDKKELELIDEDTKSKINSIFLQHKENKNAINLRFDAALNVSLEKKKEALNSLFKQHEIVLESILKQGTKECGWFSKPRENGIDTVNISEGTRTELESGSQPENKNHSEEKNQFVDSILEHINGFMQKEATSGMTYSGTWTSETCVFKDGVKTCTEKSGQF